MNEKIDKQRALDMFYLFSKGMMITNSPDLKKFEKRLGVDAREFLEQIINGIAIDGVKEKHIEDFTRHIIFMKQACLYILNETDDIPTIQAERVGNDIKYKI